MKNAVISLILNISKTKDLVVDYWSNRRPLVIQGKVVERVDSYKYLGVQINKKTGLVSQHPLQEGTEQTILPQETTIW